MNLTLDAREVRGWVVVGVTGDVDVYTAGQLDRYLAENGPTPASSSGADLARRRGLVVDLREVAFVDSAGLGVLVAACRRERAVGSGLRLVSTSAQLQTMLTITQLSTVMPTFPDRESATSA